MGLSDAQLIREAVVVNHKRVDRKTRNGYEVKLGHYSDYLASVHSRNLYTAQRKHVLMFIDHLREQGGRQPDESRINCSWCRRHGYPDGKGGCGWAESTVKGYLSAIRFVYAHFLWESDLPDHDPCFGIDSPKVVSTPQWSPTREEVERLLEAPGRPRDRLLAHWIFFAPSRREPFRNALWTHLDLDAGTWDLVGKGLQEDMFDLHPRLLPVLRDYRRWQLKEAQRNPKIAAALANEDTAYVLLTRNGRPLTGQTVTKLLKWRAVRAGVAVIDTDAKHDAPGGKTSRVSPHALRRAWARLGLNHPTKPVPLDVVSEVLRHKDISTTRRHYAQTKPERARQALRDFDL
jgi:integrase